MKIRMVAAVIASGVMMYGCASVVGEGSTQNISVATTPMGASCTFFREGEPIGTIASTPGKLVVTRRKHDIVIRCNKPGYGEAAYVNHSGMNKMVAANVAADFVLTAGLSSIVDSSTGADNEYTSDVVITLRVTGMMQAPGNTRPKPVERAGPAI